MIFLGLKFRRNFGNDLNFLKSNHFVTFTVMVFLIFLYLAVSLAVPAFFALAFPFFVILITEDLLEDHWMAEEVIPVPFALKVKDLPFFKDFVFLEMLMEAFST